VLRPAAIMDALRHTGKLSGLSASGVQYDIRAAKDFPNGNLLEISQGNYLVKTCTPQRACRWAAEVGFEVLKAA